jgi:hypothetical protein
LNGKLLGQKKVASVSFGDFDHLAAVAQLGHIFFQNDFHDDSVSLIDSLLCASGEGQQSDVASLLYCPRQSSLVRRANTGQTPRSDLPALRHELREETHVLVIDGFDLLDAKLANLLAPEVFASAFARTAGTSGTWSSWWAAAIPAGRRTVCACFFCHNFPAFWKSCAACAAQP